MHTLQGWEAAFNSNFDNAEIVLVSVGVGTYNQGQIGYFDDVEISHTYGGGFAERLKAIARFMVQARMSLHRNRTFAPISWGVSRTPRCAGVPLVPLLVWPRSLALA